MSGQAKFVSPDDVKPSFGKGPCERRTNAEKILAGLSLLLLAALVGLIVAFALLKDENAALLVPEKVSEVCMTKSCIIAASSMAQRMDTSADPCTDFYEFSCGTWIKKHLVPESRSSIGSFSVIADDIDITVKNLLERDKEELESVQKAKNYYMSCLNTAVIEERNVTMLPAFFDTVGHWPVITPNWDATSFNLTQQLLRLNRYGIFPIFQLWAGTDEMNTTRAIITIDRPSFGMPSREYLLKGRDDVMVVAYEKLARSIAIELGADAATAEADMSDMVDFEIDLANISTPVEDRRNSTLLYNNMTLEDLAQRFGPFDWNTYIREMFATPSVNIAIVANEPVVVQDTAYYGRLAGLLDATHSRVLANYMMWRMVHQLSYNLPKKFGDLLQDYRAVLYGSSSKNPRWKTCASEATSYVGLAIGRLFVEENFDKEAKENMMEMIDNLKSSMDELIQGLDWMDSETKPAAMEKADAMARLIGFPENPNILDDTVLNDIYKMINYSADHYFENNLNNLQKNIYDRLYDLRDPIDKTRWTTPPTTVNAYYSPTKNNIMFPAGILQPPFYKKDQPLAMNYGGIGVVIGHEITHGFDDQGSQNDKDGNLIPWWTDESVENFKEKKQCIIDQYGSYFVEDVNMTLNGINTQGENIADNGGLKESFRAYRDLIKRRGSEEPTLPGLGYTNNQLFFVNFAQVWCYNRRQQTAIAYVLDGVHSLPRFRVIGTLQNSWDFADAFSCPVGSFMNPEKKCSVW